LPDVAVVGSWDICPIPETFTGKIAENAPENARGERSRRPWDHGGT
jgi:hypothetical protein